MPSRPAGFASRLKLLSVFFAVGLGILLVNPSAWAAKVLSSSFASGTFEIGQGISYSVTVEGTTPFDIANPGGGNQVEGPYAYILYIQGTDIYGNATYIEVRRGVLGNLRGDLFAINQTPTGPTTVIVNEPTRATVDGTWFVPNDGTLHRLGPGGYGFVFALYPTANFPTTMALFEAPILSAGSTSTIFISVTPDLRINAPGALYRAGLYRSKDIIRFTTSWRNNQTMDNVRQSRPLRPINQDAYVVNLRLSTDPTYNEGGGANDDFNLMYGANGLRVAGDLGGLFADSTTEWRKITVTSTPGRIPPYGIEIAGSVPPAFIPETQRNYTPQPDDGFLDIGERVELTTEQLIPDSYEGRYFVASDVRMSNVALDARPENNTFVSNAANKIEVLAASPSAVEPASAILDQNGNYIQGANGASDYSSVSDGGNFIAFASRAQNLLVPPNLATSSAEVPPQFRTAGQQIFLRNRQMRETTLASRSAGNLAADADCFNPSVSANGQFVAFESAAGNLVDGANTGGKSMIYVYDRSRARPVIISRNRNGDLANGDCTDPSISESGRFVAFESIASNLDLPQFTANLSGGRVQSFTKVRGGAGYNPAKPPVVTVSAPQIGSNRATATATVETDAEGYGTIRSITVTSPGSGYTSPPTVTVEAPPAGYKQIYLHDRNVDGRTDTNGNSTFDVAGNTATYLVSINERGAVAGQLCMSPAVSIQDDAATITRNNDGVFVAFVSYAKAPGLNAMPLGTGYAMVYRTRVKVNGAANTLGAVRSSVTAVSVNDSNETPAASSVDASGALIVPYSWEPAISGDGSQVAFTSAGTNLVFNPDTGAYDADTNQVPDVFVRNLALPTPRTVRVSVSQERVATGTILFSSQPFLPGNIPVNQPALGDFVDISDGIGTRRFTFAAAGGGNNVPIGTSVEVTRNSLVAAINGSGLNIIAEATTPPNDAPGTSYIAGIYLKNTLPGAKGNVPITVSSAVLVVNGMAGGGSQAVDAPDAIQGAPFGSNQPSIDRSGRFVAFRSIAQNLDVHVATDSNSYPESPITGELIRPLIFPSSNVYLHDRLADGDQSRGFDASGNYLTSRISVSKFGYPAVIFGSEPTGVEATTSANSSAPAISPDARFVSFSTDSEGAGGLIYGPNNLSPLDNNRFRDVLVHDRVTVGENPPIPSTKPTITLLAPSDGLKVAPNTPITISASARAAFGKSIASVSFFVNNVAVGAPVTAEPFSVTYTVPTTGEYLIRAVATDSSGLTSDVFATVFAERPPEGAPFVQMTQPIAGLNFVTGSKLFLNAIATATGGATISKDSVKLSVNGIDSNDPIGQLGDKYGVLYTPTEPFIVDTYRATATDSRNVSNQSAPLFSFLTLALSPLPEVRVLPLSPAIQVNVGSTVLLSAEAFFPETGYNNGRIPERVEFYVNKVYVGEATAGAVLPNGRTLYTLNWEVDEEFVDRTAGDGPQIFEVYARAVALNWQTNAENNNVIEVYGSVVDGPTPLPVYFVPQNPSLGSNAAFVKDNFAKLFFREPTYDEYSYYLGLLNSGNSQTEVVVQMAQSLEFSAHQQVLFGFYARMGLKPTSKTNLNDPTSVANLLNLMTNGTNGALLPAAMTAGVTGVAGLAPSPYGATVGQALVAERLIGTITNRWNGVLPRLLDNQPFMDWMRRSMNQPYLPQPMPTNIQVVRIGSDADLLNTIGSFPSATNSKPSRFGYSFAFLSALYDAMPLQNVPNSTNNDLRSTLSNFPGLVQGAAVTYLLSPTGQWPTNSFGAVSTNAVLSTNLVASNLPPQITSTNRITRTVGVTYANFYRITANNVGSSPGFAASNLPPGVSAVDRSSGIISGTPTNEGTFQAIVSATNGAGVGRLAVIMEVLPEAPEIPPSTAQGTNNTAFIPFSIPVTPTNTATAFGIDGLLPPGLFFTASNGMISGTPQITGTFTNAQTYSLTMFATNKAGVATNSLSIVINPSLTTGSLTNRTGGGSAAVPAAPSSTLPRMANGGSSPQTVLPGVLTTLHSFTGSTNGAHPESALVQGAEGVMFGSTAFGGNGDRGTLYRITPSGSFSNLHRFTFGKQGYGTTVLTRGADGRVYGVRDTPPHGDGAIFALPSNGVLEPLYTVNSGNAVGPGLLLGLDGNFYGSYRYGSSVSVFRFKRDWSFGELGHLGADAQSLPTTLVQGLDGNLYGALSTGAVDGKGSVFRVSLSGDFGVLYEFQGDAHPSWKVGGLTVGSGGDLYGTTSMGESGTNAPSEESTIFRVTPNGQMTTLARFAGSRYFNALVEGTDGNLYGTTSYGGTNGTGMIFRLTPSGTLTELQSFAGTNGAHPVAGLLQGNDGSFYGTTRFGGSADKGTIFRFTVAPAINSPTAAAGRKGATFVYQITAHNGPMSYSAGGLPRGLSVNPATGLIAGKPEKSGTYVVDLFATNTGGTGSAKLTITIDDVQRIVGFNPPKTVIFRKGRKFSLPGTATSGLRVQFSSSNAKVLSISGRTATIRGKGSVTITARQPGNNRVAPAPTVTRTLRIR